jgi:hypothetical protein
MAKKQFEGVFEVSEVKPRKLRNGNRMQITLEAPYDEKQFAKLVHFNFMDVSMFIEEFDDGQQELDGIEQTPEG